MLDRPISSKELIMQSWMPRPNTGIFWKDLIFLLFIVFMQTTVAPALLGKMGHLDFLTPWLVITFIRQRAPQACLFAIIGGLLLETRLAVPAGLYITAYLIVCTLLVQIRPALSWRYRTPWLVCYASASLWLVMFEGFVIHFLQTASPLRKWEFLVQTILKIFIAIGFGMLLSRKWMKLDAEEPVPQ